MAPTTLINKHDPSSLRFLPDFTLYITLTATGLVDSLNFNFDLIGRGFSFGKLLIANNLAPTGRGAGVQHATQSTLVIGAWTCQVARLSNMQIRYFEPIKKWIVPGESPLTFIDCDKFSLSLAYHLILFSWSQLLVSFDVFWVLADSYLQLVRSLLAALSTNAIKI